MQSGLAGMGLFMITLLAGELAARLAREELAARGSLELARQQAQLNRLVIEEMADGVLVVDRRLLVRAANPAARALLVDQGLGPTAPFMLDRNYSPPTMKVEVWQKDMQVIGDMAKSLGCPVPLFNACAPIYTAAMAQGLSQEDTASVAEVLGAAAGLPGRKKPRRSA